MAEEHLKTAVEVYTRQHEFYAEQTALALQFPIKLILTLNASAISVFLLIIRGNIENIEETHLIDALKESFWFFGFGIIFVLIASWFQWRLYSFIMHRKRKLLEEALTSKNLQEAMNHFCNEPKDEPNKDKQKTNHQIWCFLFVIFSFVCFLCGIYKIGFTI